MALSNDLISQFAKITKDEKVTTDKVVYGTIVDDNDGVYVIIDGSDIPIPIETTTDTTTHIGKDERVSIMIKDHRAVITGNFTEPAVRNKEIYGEKGLSETILQQSSEFKQTVKGFTATVNKVVLKSQMNGQNILIDSLGEKSIDRSSTGNTTLDYEFDPYLNELSDKEFTFAFEARGSVNGIRVDFYFRSSEKSISNSAQMTLGTEYNSYTQTIVLNSSVTPKDIAYCRVRVYSGNGGTVYIKNARLVQRTASDAILEENIVKTESKIIQEAGKIRSEVTETVSKIEGDISDNANVIAELGKVVEEHSSSIEQLPGEITSTVTEKIYAAQAASRNILLDVDEPITLIRIDENGNVTHNYEFQEYLNSLTDTEYAFSFEAYGSVNGMHVDFYFSNAISGGIISTAPGATLSTGYKKYILNVALNNGFTPKDIKYCRFRVRDISGTVYVKNAKLERKDDVYELANRMSSVEQTASSVTTRVEEVEKAMGDKSLVEISAGSVDLGASKLLSTVILSDYNVKDGDMLTWSIRVTPRAQKNIGLELDFGQKGIFRSELTLVNMNTETLLSYSATVPSGATIVYLSLYDSDSTTSNANTAISHRDGLLTVKTENSFVKYSELKVTTDGIMSRVEALENNTEDEDEGGIKNLVEIADGSAELATEKKIGDRYILSEYGIKSGDMLSWSIYVKPDVTKNIGLNMYFGAKYDYKGELTLVAASDEIQLTYSSAVPSDATFVELYLHDNNPSTTDTTANVAYRDSLLYIDNSALYVKYTEFRQTVNEITVNVGKKLDADKEAVGVVVAGMTINEDGVFVTGKDIELESTNDNQYLRVNGSGVSASSLQAPNVTPRYDGPTNVYIDPSKAKEGEQDGKYYYKSLDDIANKVSGRYLDKQLSIICDSPSIDYCVATFKGIVGSGVVRIGTASEDSKYVINGRLMFDSCSSRIEVSNLDIQRSGTGDAKVPTPLEILNCSYVRIYNSRITSSGDNAVLISDGSRVTFDNSEANATSTGTAIMINKSAYAYCGDTVGVGSIMANIGGIGVVYGKTPSGGTIANRGVIHNAGITDATPTTPPSVSATTTKEYIATSTISIRATDGSDKFPYDNDVRQGYTPTNGKIIGCMWFGSLDEGSVKQASIRLCKVSDDFGGTGSGGTVKVHLWGIQSGLTKSSTITSSSLIEDYDEIGTVSPGAPNTITIPTSAAKDLVDGTISGFALYLDDESSTHSNYSYSKNYMRFYGETTGDDSNKPMLTITYQ